MESVDVLSFLCSVIGVLQIWLRLKRNQVHFVQNWFKKRQGNIENELEEDMTVYFAQHSLHLGRQQRRLRKLLKKAQNQVENIQNRY